MEVASVTRTCPLLPKGWGSLTLESLRCCFLVARWGPGCKAVVGVIRSRLSAAFWAEAETLNPILGQISCSSLRAVIIDPLATSQGVREQLGFATVVADRFQVRRREKKPVAGAGLETEAWVRCPWKEPG